MIFFLSELHTQIVYKKNISLKKSFFLSTTRVSKWNFKQIVQINFAVVTHPACFDLPHTLHLAFPCDRARDLPARHVHALFDRHFFVCVCLFTNYALRHKYTFLSQQFANIWALEQINVKNVNVLSRLWILIGLFN